MLQRKSIISNRTVLLHLVVPWGVWAVCASANPKPSWIAVKIEHRNNNRCCEQKTQVTTRLLAVLGVTSALIACLLSFLMLLFTYLGGHDTYFIMSGPITLINILIAFITGILLKTRCPNLGYALIALSLILLLFGLWLPSL